LLPKAGDKLFFPELRLTHELVRIIYLFFDEHRLLKIQIKIQYQLIAQRRLDSMTLVPHFVHHLDYFLGHGDSVLDFSGFCLFFILSQKTYR
jgi:hypothetical protein